ncbi:MULTISPECIES: hypothetical protein [Streptomyces]|uniref:hypothetical protein n=1 Tax=Streptomyces TaxID=1883 RepID=UPI002ED1ABA2|nr:hypothetical protein OHB17_42970 [Streptomyces sp. NBC_00724]
MKRRPIRASRIGVLLGQEIQTHGYTGGYGAIRKYLRPFLDCTPDDPATMRTARDRTADPVTVSALDSELADLDREHTTIRIALRSRFDGLDHDHI